MASIAFGMGLAAVSLLGALWLFQDRLIYPAPHYSARELSSFPPDLVVLRDPTNAASIVGFYRAAPGATVPSSCGYCLAATATSRSVGMRWSRRSSRPTRRS